MQDGSPGSAHPGKSILATGFVSLAFTAATAITISAAFDIGVFLSWAGLFWMASVPFQTVAALLWQFEYPDAIGRLRQPGKGAAFLVLTAIAGGVVGLGLFIFPGGGNAPPGPQLIMLVNFSISVALWWIVAFGGWPIIGSARSPVISGVLLTAAIYPLSYLLFQYFFNFSFLPDARSAASPGDPRGLFNAWTALVFGITTVAILLAAVLNDFWFLGRLAEPDRPWLKGACLAAIVLPLSAGVLWTAVELFGFSAIRFMLWGPVAGIFGFFVLTGFFQNRFLAHSAQPLKGIVLTVAAYAAGLLMVAIYWVVAGWIFEGKLVAGPPGYDHELWVANALLAVTFPLTVAITGGFELWPFQTKASGGARPAV